MKKWIIRIVIGLVVLAGVAYGSGQAYFYAMKQNWVKYNEYDVRSEGMLAVGDLAPDLELGLVEGDSVRLSSFFGEKPVVLVFGSYT